MRMLIVAASLLSLVACKEELAGKPQPVELTADAVGFYCQMELLDHVGPKGQIHLEGMPAPVFFSQVRDAIGYLHMPEQSHAVVATYVQDMTGADWANPGGWIAVESAVYVIGSDRMGGMNAPEYVPFSDPDAARNFAAKHGGEVRHFEQIGADEVLAVAETDHADEHDMSTRLNALQTGKGTN